MAIGLVDFGGTFLAGSVGFVSGFLRVGFTAGFLTASVGFLTGRVGFLTSGFFTGAVDFFTGAFGYTGCVVFLIYLVIPGTFFGSAFLAGLFLDPEF